MGKLLLIIFVLVANGVCVIAQDLAPSAKQDSTDNSVVDLALRRSNPLLIVNAGNRSLQIPPSTEPYHSLSLDILGIEGSWIQSTRVINGQEAINTYGSLGQNGVVIVELKEDAFGKMPADLAQRFKIN